MMHKEQGALHRGPTINRGPTTSGQTQNISLHLASRVQQELTLHSARLQVCLQQVSGDSYGPEEGSDAWLLLSALVGTPSRNRGNVLDASGFLDTSESYDTALLSGLENSGRHLAEQGGKLETRLQGLQRYIDALTAEMRTLFKDQPALLVEAISFLTQLQSTCVLALTRGYQGAVDQVASERWQATQRLEQRLQVLQRINSAANSTTDLDQTLEITAKAVATELGVDVCSIFFYDELQRILTLRATNGPRPLGGMHFTLRLGEGYSGWVADKGRPLLVRDALADPHFSTEARTYNAEYHGLMAVPVIFFGDTAHLIGVISVQSADPRDFTGDDLNFVEVVAGIIAINIENGRLYEQTDEQLRRKVNELATIHRVSSIIASTLNLDEVLQIITTQAVHLSGAERSCIFELDAEKKYLRVLAHYGLNDSDVRRIRIPVGQCCAGRTVETGEPRMAVDCMLDDQQCFFCQFPPFLSRDRAGAFPAPQAGSLSPTQESSPWEEQHPAPPVDGRGDPGGRPVTAYSGGLQGSIADVHSVLCVPLTVKREVLGCICIYSSHRHMLSPEQMQLVVIFANEAAIAIENARLFEEARRGLELKSALLREMHHRVKNNLATVGGILSLQRRRTRSPEVRHILAESVNRVQGLAATHDLLSHEDVSEARVDDIARKIVGVASANLPPPETHITFQVEPCPVVIPSRAVAILALVLNEMVSNAIKHGMAGMKEGAVTIRGHKEDGMMVVEVIDSGEGPPQSLEESDEGSAFEGLGISLIKHLIGDLGGEFTLQASEANTTVAQVRFPLLSSES